MQITIAQSILDDSRLKELVDSATAQIQAELGPYMHSARIGWDLHPQFGAQAAAFRLTVVDSAECEISVDSEELADGGGAFRRRFQRLWGDAVRESFGYPRMSVEETECAR